MASAFLQLIMTFGWVRALPRYSLTMEQSAVKPRSPPRDGPDETQSFHGSVLQEGERNDAVRVSF